MFIIAECQKFRFVRDQFHFVLATILVCEEEKVLEVVDTIGDKYTIISKSDAGDDEIHH